MLQTEREPSAIAVTALGAATSLGPIIQAAAAARAGLTRAKELADCIHFDEETLAPTPIAGHPAAWLTEGFEGFGRLVQLGLAALEDLLDSAPRVYQDRLEWFLSLPKDLGSQETAQRLVEVLQEEIGLALRSRAIHYFLEERGGTVRAILEAAHGLSSRRCDHALVLACDSLVDPERASHLLSKRRLKTPDNPIGFMPGEAGAAVLLERRDTLRRRGQRPLGLLLEPITGFEPKSLAAKSPPVGSTLADVIITALTQAQANDAAEGSVYLDLNGEVFRANDWGYALLRVQKACRLDGWSQHIPAISFGETGVASPLLALCLALRAFARGYGRGRHALLLVSGDEGYRAGIVLEAPMSAQSASY